MVMHIQILKTFVCFWKAEVGQKNQTKYSWYVTYAPSRFYLLQ